MRESTRRVRTRRSYQQVTVRCGAGLRLGTRIGLATASNDARVWRLTGSLPLVQKSLAGVVMVVGSVFVFSLKALRFFFFYLGFAGWGWTMRPMAQTNPLNSRPKAAAATAGFLRAGPIRCL